MANRILVMVLAAVFSAVVLAQTVELNPDHPDRYVVVKGDTLWDISGRFLKSPWLWPEVWYVNPQIANPHLIYPGDIITLVYVDGRPQLRVQRGRPHVKLSPHARAERLDQAIPTIPLDAIKQFLSKPLVVGEDELERAPYVVDSADEHIVTGAGDRVYARGIDNEDYRRFNVFRPGDTYIDPDTNEILGYEALYVGDADAQRFGDPSTLMLTATNREVRKGDRLLPVTSEIADVNFMSRAPQEPFDGRIISVVDGVTQIGQYQIVVINRGTREGVEVGHVLRVRQAGKEIRDTIRDEKVTLPDEDAGLMMIFRTFDKVSYGLIMEATRAIHVLDTVTNP